MASVHRSVGLRFSQVTLIVTLMLGAASSARAGVTSIEMLAPNVGWVTTSDSNGGKDSLLWTADGGAHWRDITPNPFTNSEYPRPGEFRRSDVQPEKIASIFFLDTHRGWVLFCCGQSDSTDAEDDAMPQYDLAMTTDSGSTWSIARVSIPAEIHGNIKYADSGQIRFADSLHGWMNMTSCNYGHTCLAQMIATSDGGRTWHPVEEDPPGGADPFSLVTPSLGWQVSIPNGWVGIDENAELYVSQDGAKNWKQVSVPFPRKMLPSAFAKKSRPSAYYHDLPTFTDSKHGFLPVTYMDENDGWKSAIVLFETADAGKSWKPIRSITNLYIPGMNASYSVEVADSTLFVITSSRDEKHITLSKDGPDGRTDTDISNYFRVQGQLDSAQLSFATSKQGWMLGKEMYSTTDGGATWRTLAPRSDEIAPTTCCAPMIHLPVDSMQLLTAEIGWASWEGDLFWTKDQGLTWTQITPARNLFGSHKILSVFFLDTRQGWALSADVVFSTIDSGVHWSMTKLDVSILQERQWNNETVGQIHFADSMHGWVSLDVEGYQNVHKSWLLITSDGGHNWKPAPTDPGLAGSILPVTPLEGWIRSPLGDELLVTHDAAHSWEKVSLTPPKDGYSKSDATYDLPTFENSEHGFLSVTYTGGLGKKAIAVLYATQDGGLTWKSDSTLRNLASMPIGSGVSSTVVGSKWITATELSGGNGNPKITPIASGGTLAASYHSESGYYGAHQLSFITPSLGWVLVSENRLLSTSDGGVTWTELNPRPSEQASLAPSRPRARVIPTLIGSMQLLGPKTGIVTAVHSGTLEEGDFHLMRTDDNGIQWKDISPLMTTTEGTSSNYFFLDANHGWLVLWNLTPAAPPSPAKPEFELESTTDGGATWSRTHIAVPELEALKGKILSGAKISFVDPVHGWMSMIVSGVGTIDIYWETTADGGKTWKEGCSSSVRPAAVRFITPTQAWMIDDARVAGGGRAYNSPSSNDLYVTRDGAKSWERVPVAIPKEVNPPDDASNTPLSTIYGVPTFADSEHGFLPVTYTAGTNPHFDYYAVLFGTADGGRTWKPDRMLFSHPGRAGITCNPGTVLSAVEGSAWLLVNQSWNSGPPSLTTLSAGASLDISPPADNRLAPYQRSDVFCPVAERASRVDFVTPSTGWIVWRGALLSTTNGGGTWTPITPELNGPASAQAAP
jgi:photosystem II stability/assembly factor-like uncharacterized protein